MKEMNKEEFIRQLAERSRFTIGDIRVIWACVEDIFADAVMSRTELNIRGFGKLYFSKIKKREAPIASTGIAGSGDLKKFPESETVVFKISRKFKGLLK